METVINLLTLLIVFVAGYLARIIYVKEFKKDDFHDDEDNDKFDLKPGLN